MSARNMLLFRIALYLFGIAGIFGYIKLCEKGLGLPCLFNELWGVICPSCGATRAFFSIISGDFSSAIAANPVFTLALYPIGAILLVQDFFVSIYRVVKKTDTPSLIEYSNLIFCKH